MSNFPAWWSFCQLPSNDGHADDGTTDGAGITRWGWTYPTWADARRYGGFTDVSVTTFDALTQAEAGQLALVYHWNRLGGRQIAGGSDVCVIDWAWTSGGAVAEIQSMLDVTPDGIVGPETISAIKWAKGFVAECTDWRIAYYTSLGLVSKFPGLLTRANACQALALTLVPK